MDPSALIFIALAVAWAAYLLPQAIKHHDRAEKTRPAQRGSGRMRVLARREPTSSRDARLVVTPAAASAKRAAQDQVRFPADRFPSAAAAAAGDPMTAQMPVVRPVSETARRAAANRAARRRRNVLSILLGVLVVVAGMALGGLFSPWFIAAPASLLGGWLVACRLMVKRERRPAAARSVRVVDDAPTMVAMAPIGYEFDEETGELVAVPEDDDPSRWDMVPVTLPIYVTKPAAEHRTVSTIDLDSTGVWTSGRSEIDSEIARRDEARRAQEREEQRAADIPQRAVGS